LIVTAFALSPDGKLLAINAANFRTLLWDVSRSEPNGRLDGGFGQLTFSPDGKLLADSAGKLWAVATNEDVPQLAKDADEAISCVAFAPDGKVLATAGSNRRPGRESPDTVRLWDLATGEELRQWEAHEKGIRSLAFSVNGELLASGSAGTRIRLWEAASGKEVRQLRGPWGGVENVLFSPDSKLLAGWGADCRISIWDLANCKVLHSFDGAEELISCIALSQDGKFLACGQGNVIGLHDPSSGKRLLRLEGHRGLVRSLAFTPDGRILASGSDDGTTRVWEASTGEALRQFEDAGGQVAVSPDGQILATGGEPICLRELATGKELQSLTADGHASRGLSFSVDGRLLASAAAEGDSYLFDVQTGQAICPYGQRSAVYPVCSQAFSPDGQVLLAVQPRLGMSLLLLDRAAEKKRGRDRGHEIFGRALAFSPDGAGLALAGVEGTIQLGDPVMGLSRHEFTGNAGTVRAVAFSGDGKLLASLHEDGTALVWGLCSPSVKAQPSGPPLSTVRKELLWMVLDDADDFAVYRTTCVLTAAGDQAVPFLHARLKGIGAVATRIERLLVDLDDDVYETRERATRALARQGVLAGPVLRKALADGLSLEAERRAEKVLRQLEARQESAAPSDLSRASRAIRVLERIGTPTARQALAALAKEPGMAWLTQDAKASLDRLERRTGK
jgi:WD40 repeat protein